MMKSPAFASFAISLAAIPSHFTGAFHGPSTALHFHSVSFTKLNYRSLHHGPDVDPSSKIERDSTKMDKDKIRHYGPGDFAQYVDHDTSDLFDGGDSEMGLAGDGNLGLRRIGRDVSPHMARTLKAKVDPVMAVHSSYADELVTDQDMDAARAQQLENWATQNEIAIANRYSYLNDGTQDYLGHYTAAYDNTDEDENFFVKPVEAGDDYEGIIALKAQLYGVAAHEFSLKNPFMGYAKFRAGFVGDASNEWSVTASDSFLKQNEATHIVVRYSPHSPGVSNACLVIEAEDFKMTWKVVGSTGEYEF